MVVLQCASFLYVLHVSLYRFVQSFPAICPVSMLSANVGEAAVTRAPDGQLTLHTSILLKHVETTLNNIKIDQTYQADAPEKR